MGLVKVVVQFKNDIVDLKPEQYISLVQVGKWSGIRSILILPSLPADSVFSPLQSVGVALRDLIQSVDEILPMLHESVRTEVRRSLIHYSTLTCYWRK